MLPFPPCFVQGPLHRCEQVLQHGARAEFDFGADLHARGQAIALLLRLEERLGQLDQGAKARGRPATSRPDIVRPWSSARRATTARQE